jgi:hypothetical protein
LSIHLSLDIPIGFFPSGFPTNIPYTFLSSPIRARCPTHLILGFTILILFGYEYMLGRAITEAVSRWIPGFAPGSSKWDLWWTKWRRGRFSPSTSVSPAKTVHSTNISIIITITRGS